MIVRYVAGKTLLDAHALYVHLDRTIAIQTIRARCTPVQRDDRTGRLLYDLEDAETALANVRTRRPHSRPTRAQAA